MKGMWKDHTEEVGMNRRPGGNISAIVPCSVAEVGPLSDPLRLLE